MKRSLAVPALVVASVLVGGGYVYWKYFAADDDLPQAATPVRTVSSPLDKERLDKQPSDKKTNDNSVVAATPSASPATAARASTGTASSVTTAAAKSTTPTPTLLPDTIRFGNAPVVRSQNMPEFSAKESAGLTGVQLPGAVTTGPQIGVPQLKLPANTAPAPTTTGPAPLSIQVTPAAGMPTLPFNNGPAGAKAPSILQPAAAPGFDPAVFNNPAPKVVAPQIPGLGQ